MVSSVRAVRNRKRKELGQPEETEEEFEKSKEEARSTRSTEQQKTEGQTFIREREKFLSQFPEGGQNAAKREFNQAQALQQPGTSQLTEEQNFRAQLTPEQRPEARDIPIQTQQAKLPGFGEGSIIQGLGSTGLGQALQSRAALESIDSEQLAFLSSKSRELGLTPEQVTNDPILQAAIRLDLNELDVEVLRSGEANVDLLDQAVEAVPLIGKAARFVGAFTTPSDEVKKILDTLEKTKTQIQTDLTTAKTNPLAARTYLEDIENQEREILRLESKIKILTIQSPELQSQPETINNMKVQIKGIKTSAFESKNELKAFILSREL